jgi:hypothetical protein
MKAAGRSTVAGEGLGVDHPLGKVLAREMRHVVKQTAVEHREVDDPLDAGFAR